MITMHLCKKNPHHNLKNLFEDLDQDGIEDHIDADDDGDGFPDASKSQMEQIQEIQNQLSTNLQPLLNNWISIAENAPKGSYVGQFHVIDPDANASIATNDSLQSTAQTLSYPFTLEQNGDLKRRGQLTLKMNLLSSM